MANKQRQQVKEVHRDPNRIGAAGVADKSEKLVSSAHPFVRQYVEKRDAAAEQIAQEVADLMDPGLFWEDVADRVVEKTAGFDYSCPFQVPEMEPQRSFVVRGQEQLLSTSTESQPAIDVPAAAV